MDRGLFTIVSHRCIRLWPLTCLWVPFLLHIPFSLPPPRELWGAPPQSLHGCTIPRVTPTPSIPHPPTPSIPHPHPVYHTQYTTQEELLYPHLSCYTFLLEGGDFSLVASQHQAQTQHIIFHSYGENSHASACFKWCTIPIVTPTPRIPHPLTILIMYDDTMILIRAKERLHAQQLQ